MRDPRWKSMESYTVRSFLNLAAQPVGRGLCVIFALLLSACSDADTNPLALPVASETHGAILLTGGFPTVPALLSQYGMEASSAPELELWWASWELDEAHGAEERYRIRLLSARRLAPAMGSAGVRDLVAKNGVSLRAAEGAAAFLQSSSIEAALEKARTSHGLASMALEAEELDRALVLALETTDALWEVTPRQVASDLLRDAETVLGRKERGRTYSQEELTRIRRLMYGASEALDAGDYPRAIRRAYYACQLLGASPP